MPYPELFDWWAATITAGTFFLVLVSLYLYGSARKSVRETSNPSIGGLGLVRSFAFVWILLSLLTLYIVSISGGSYILFAIGNIIVEAFLLVYIIKSR